MNKDNIKDFASFDEYLRQGEPSQKESAENRKMLSEDFHRITFLAIDACHIYHRHIHTDVVRPFADVCNKVMVAVGYLVGIPTSFGMPTR